jgi:protocatechuate 3,4-dioxygenase beta subunit
LKTSRSYKFATFAVGLLLAGVLVAAIQCVLMIATLVSIGNTDEGRQVERFIRDGEASDSRAGRKAMAVALEAPTVGGLEAATKSVEWLPHSGLAFRPDHDAPSNRPLSIALDSPDEELHSPESYGISISGRVLDWGGVPIPGIEVSAGPYGFLEDVEDPAIGMGSKPRSFSDKDGAYEIWGLVDGDYVIRTIATVYHPSVTAIVRAGVEAVDLIIAEMRKLLVRGVVTDTNGDPLAEVRVESAPPSRETRTDDEGNYEIRMVGLRTDKVPSFDFLLPGYHKVQLNLRDGWSEGPRTLRLDVELESVAGSAGVSGTLNTDRGYPIPGQTIRLSSALQKTAYSVTSDRYGRFSVPVVAVGSDYHLFVRPSGPYQDYLLQPLVVAQDGLSIDIVLKPLDEGRLTGQMVDAEENPLSDLRLWLWSEQSRGNRIEVWTDSRGFFAVEGAPEGELKFSSRSRPYLEIGGITLAGREDKDVLLVVDWGEHGIEGRVIDASGGPVSGAQVSLSWSHQGGAIRSISSRGTVADEEGFFRFAQLGPGDHQLTVTAPGYHGARKRHKVGAYSRDVEVRLETISR